MPGLGVVDCADEQCKPGYSAADYVDGSCRVLHSTRSVDNLLEMSMSGRRGTGSKKKKKREVFGN